MQEMNFDEFYEYINKSGKDSFQVTFTGTETESNFSGKKYLFYESTVYFGEPDIKSVRRSPFHTEDAIFLVYENIKVELDYRKIRAFLQETYSKTFTKKEESPEYIQEILAEEAKKVLLCEFGLLKGKIYHARFSSEEYHLPPREKGGEPVTRSNRVLWISDKPYINNKPQVELTPLYQGWSY